MKPQTKHQPRDTFGIAGWLFADLSLALAILFAASALPGIGPEPAAAASPAPSPTVAPTRAPSAAIPPSPSPTPEPTQCRRTAVLKKHQVIVEASRTGVRPTLKRLLAPFAKYSGQQVGLLLTYGHGETPAAGKAIAGEVNTLLRKRLPDQVTDQTIQEAFFNDAGRLGSVTFDIYLLADVC